METPSCQQIQWCDEAVAPNLINYGWMLLSMLCLDGRKTIRALWEKLISQSMAFSTSPSLEYPCLLLGHENES
jgi:hypothetical protein